MFIIENSEITDQKGVEITHNPPSPRRGLEQGVDRTFSIHFPNIYAIHAAGQSFLYSVLRVRMLCINPWPLTLNS